jgi:hypothetical protein
MKNKPWKTWKTRKVTFIAVCILWLVMAILGLCGREIDPTIIDFIFGAGKWLLTFGIVLVISDKTGDMLLKRNGGNGDEL